MQTLNENLPIIQALDDLPNAVGGLTADQLKAEFDKGYKTIVHWLNDVMLPAFASVAANEGASQIGIQPIVGLTGVTNVQDALSSVMDAFVTGTVPDESVTTPKLADSATTTPKIADGAVTTPKIADGAVTPAKTDFSSGSITFGGSVTLNQIIKLNSNVYYNYGTLAQMNTQTPMAGRLYFAKVQG